MKKLVLLLGIVLLALVLVLVGHGRHQPRTGRVSVGYQRLGSRLPLRVMRTSQAPKTVRAVKHKQS